MRVKKATLTAAITDLERALAEPAGRLERALAGVEQAIGRQDAFLESSGNPVIDVGSGQTPSPGLERQVEHFHKELEHLRQGARNLLARARQQPEGGEELRRQALALLGALKHYQEGEDRLVQELSTTDIGTGD